MKLSIIELNRIAADARLMQSKGFTTISLSMTSAASIADELLAAREVIAAVETLLSRAEVKAAAMMAPSLASDINRLRDALKNYKAK